MTAVPNSGVLGPSVGNVSQTNFKTAIEQVVSVLKELIGGAGFTTRTVAAGTFSVVKDYALYTVDGEGSAADTIDTIGAGTTTLRDGQIIGIKSAGVDLTYTNNVGGAKQIYTRTGAALIQRGTSEITWWQYRTAADAWYQILPDWSAMLLLLLGAQPLATLTPSSNVVTPASALIAIDSGAAVDVNQIARTNFPDDGRLLLVSGANATYARTLKHNVGTAGKLLHTDSADIVLNSASKWVLYYATTVGGNKCWQEITRFGFTTSSGAWTKIDKSASFNVTDPSKTRYIVDTSGGAVTATWTGASPADGLSEWEFVILGNNNFTLAAYSGEAIIHPTGSDASLLFPAGSYRIVRAVAVTGGLAV